MSLLELQGMTVESETAYRPRSAASKACSGLSLLLC